MDPPVLSPFLLHELLNLVETFRTIRNTEFFIISFETTKPVGFNSKYVCFNYVVHLGLFGQQRLHQETSGVFVPRYPCDFISFSDLITFPKRLNTIFCNRFSAVRLSFTTMLKGLIIYYGFQYERSTCYFFYQVFY